MSELVSSQNAIISQYVEDHAYLEELIKEDANLNQSLLLSLQKEAEMLMVTARSNHVALLNSKKTTDLITKYLSEDTFAQLRRKYHIYWARIEDKIVREPKTDPSLCSTILQDSQIGLRNVKVKLNPLSLPTFSGDIRTWKSFYNSFVSLVEENTRITVLDKLRYLLDCLAGDAKSLVTHLPVEENNYRVALKLLIDRYDHKRVLVNVQLNTLYNLEYMKKESATNIRKTIDLVRECYQSLKGLEIDVEAWSPVIIFLVQNKLPQQVNQLWEEKLNNSKELPTFSQFEDFLECRFRTLDILTPRLGTNSSTVFHIQNNNNDMCQLCNKTHFISNCQQFLGMNQYTRYKTVLNKKLCINCLSNYHMLDNCNSKHSCRECSKRHHTLLHREFPSNNKQNKVKKPPPNNLRKNPRLKSSRNDHPFQNNQERKQQESSQIYTTQIQNNNPNPSNSDSVVNLPTTVSHHIHSISKGTFLLGTAVVQVSNDHNKSRAARVLLDTGSEDNYIIDSLVNGLPLRKYYSPSSISVIGGQLVEGIIHRCDFTIKSLHNDFEIRVNAGIKRSITPDLPKEPIPGICYSFLNNLKLADPSFDEPGQIDILLGMGVWVQIIQNGLVKGESLVAQKTTLGWLVQGVTGTNPVSTKYKTQPSRCYITQALEDQMQKFWELEGFEDKRVLDTPEDELCEQITLKSIRQLDDKKLSVDLPFKDDSIPSLGRSKEIAKNRFFNLEKRLNHNSKLRDEYHKTIEEYIQLGHMKLIEDQEFDGLEYYLPHHAVVKESSTTTKVRVVFDASCKTTNSTSLNDHLLTGKKLQIDIRDILMRWRQYPFVFSADIEKMYRQFWVNEHHHKYQKVLWRFSEFEPLKSYVLTTVTFGTSAAPFLALRLLKYIADSEKAKQFPLASRAIHLDFYVDDLLSGSYSQDEAIQTQIQMRKLLEHFGLLIRKWCSNEKKVLQTIPSEHCEIIEHSFDETDFKKTLGIYWSPSKDSFAFSVESMDFAKLKLTKRKTLSLIARLYDPLGWLGPCTTYAKLIMQRVWQSAVNWDDEIPQNLKCQFKYFLEDLQKLNTISIPRWIKCEERNTPITLLGFADASELGFGCVVYLDNVQGQKENILLTSRSRVAPLNFTTIARLELCAALLLAEVLEWCETLFPERRITVHAFSDSKIVLSWLQAHPTKWKTFVANRTSEILRRYTKEHWHYINTKENPADLISRGLLPSEIVSNELWWNGPNNVYLDQPFHLESEQEKKMLQHETKQSQTCLRTQPQINSLLTYFSNNMKLFKRVSTITSFIMKCLLKCCKTYPHKTQRYLALIERLQNPEYIVFRLVQYEHFAKEIECLKNNKCIDKQSKIRTLSPYIDGFGILRVGSRLEKSETLTYDQKYPIILPSHNQVTNNIISQSHSATMHGSLKLMFSYIRNKYHILRGRERINNFIRRCVNCIRYARIQQNQLMGSLPFPRVNESKPFLFSGVDYAGPMLIRNKFSRGSKTSKAYIAIFICLCTKAIHLELVSDLTTESFLASLRRFVYRRGRVQVMHSDCGTNFKGASKTLMNECHEAQITWKNELQPYLKESGIEWDFNPPASPHFGGLWEAGVKSIKTHLNRTLKDSILTFEAYYTVLVQIEGILNSRPLCPLSDNPNTFEFLTPSHFLVGEPIVAPPEPKYEVKSLQISDRKRWRQVQALQQQYWSQWRGPYLHTLLKRPKWLGIQRNFQVGDLVLITDNNVAPTIWPRARIIDVHPGHDGNVRVVTLKTSEGKVFKRPIVKLRFLPISSQEELNPQKVNDPT